MLDNEENSNKSQEKEEKSSKSEKDQEKTKEKDLKNKNGTKKMIDEFIIKETIGKGTFSTVKLGEHITTKEKVAIKILNKEKIKAKEDLVRIKREIKILLMMDHPNIIKTYKISENPKNFYIIMEYCNGGELFNYIVEKEKLEENEASMFFYQLINALEYIHSLGIAHRDLKPENLLLIDNKIIKIIDFGLSNYFNGEKNLETPCGSPSYASPEIIKGEAYNGFSIDIWASGIIMFAMLCGYLPFDDDEEEEDDEEGEEKSHEKNKSEDNNEHNSSEESNESDDNEILFQRILEGKLDFPDYLSKDAIDLMKKILVVDPKQRIEIKDIKKHKFYLLGQKNFLLNQKNISKHIKPSKIETEKEKEKEKEKVKEKEKEKEKEREKVKEKNKEKDKENEKDKTIINNENININIINNKNNYYSNKRNKSENKTKKNSSNGLINLDEKLNEIINNSLKFKEENKKEIKTKNHKIESIKHESKNHKIESITNEMEEYEKKLYKNYLRNVIAIKKTNIKLNKRIKTTKRNKNNNIENGFYYRLNTINVNQISSNLNKNLQKNSNNKNNYTLNEIILDFNPNDYESNKQLMNSSPKSYKLYNFNSYNYNYNQYMPPLKINPIYKRNNEYQNGFNQKNNSILFHKENNKNFNRDNNHNLLTINIPNISSKRRNHTDNKLLRDIKYYITNDNYKKLDESNKHINYLKIPKLHSIDHTNDVYRVKSRKPILPIIKPSLFSLFSNNSIQNKDSSFLSPFTHLKTEAESINRKKMIFNGMKNDYNVFVNNTNNSINNDFKYKLFFPSYKKYNISTLKGAY